MNATRAVRLVALREVREGMRNRTLRVTFAVMLVGIVAGAFVPTLFTGEDTTALGVVEGLDVDDAALVAAADAVEIDLEVTRTPDEAAAVNAIEDGAVDAALVGDLDAPELLVEQRADATLRAAIAGVLGRDAIAAELEALGLPPEEGLGALTAGPPLQVRPLEEPTDDGAILFAFVGTIFLFFAVTFFASRVLTGVVEEKSSRVVEVVLGAMRPGQLLAGKLLGIGVLAFAQVAILTVVAIVSVVVSGVVELPTTAVASVVGLVGWFAVGFATYSVVYAAAGALVSRVEDAQSSSGPIGILLFVAYVVTFSVVVPEPEGTVARIVSQVPGIAPLAMPARIALGAVGWVELLVSVVISLVTIYAAVRLAGVIYRRSLLRTQKATWREALTRSPSG